MPVAPAGFWRLGMALLLLLCAPGFAEQQTTFRSDVLLVKVDVQVAQGQRLLGDLQKEDFRVLDNGEPREIVYFGRESEPLSVLLLLDVSGSMRQHVQAMARASRKAMSALREGDTVALMIFSREAEVLRPFTDDHDQIARTLDTVVRRRGLGSGTSMNTSIIQAADYMRTELSDEGGRRAIIVLTDNRGWNYASPDHQVVEALWNAETVLNAIVVGGAKPPEPLDPEHVTNMDFTPSNVFHLATETGGDVVRGKNAGTAFQALLEGMRTRYSLHYRAPQSDTGNLHEIRVELAGDAARRYRRAEVRARRGYYLPSQ